MKNVNLRRITGNSVWIEQGEISADELAAEVKRVAPLTKICKDKLATTEEDTMLALKLQSRRGQVIHNVCQPTLVADTQQRDSSFRTKAGLASRSST